MGKGLRLPWRSWINRRFQHHFFNQMLLFFIVFQLLIFILLAVPIAGMMYQKLEERDYALNREILNRIENEFTAIHNSVRQLMEQINLTGSYHDSLTFFLKHPLSEWYDYRMERALRDISTSNARFDILIGLFLKLTPQVEQVRIIRADGTSGFLLKSNNSRLLKQDEIERSLPRNNPFFQAYYLPEWVMINELEEKIELYSIRYPIFEHLYGSKIIGYLIADIKKTALAGTFFEYAEFLRGDVSINYNQHEIIRLDDPHQENVGSVLISNSLPELKNISINQFFDYTLIRKEYELLRNLVTLLLFSSFIFASGFMAILVKTVNQRISDILKGIEAIKLGEFRKKIPSDWKDEFGQIAKSFNEMGEDLENYIERNYLLKLAQKEAEVKHLFAQINPHFLNNTLEIIRMKALADGSTETAEMIFYLSRMFHDMSRMQEMMITLEEELKHCKEYLRICELRYGSVFDVEFSIPPECLEDRILKFALQPLLENYFIHGLSWQSNNNKVTVVCSHTEESLTLIIHDNGKGIKPQRLLELKNILREDPKKDITHRIGLINIHKRVRLMFGQSYGISLDSCPEKWTKVTMKIPRIKENIVV